MKLLFCVKIILIKVIVEQIDNFWTIDFQVDKDIRSLFIRLDNVNKVNRRAEEDGVQSDNKCTPVRRSPSTNIGIKGPGQRKDRTYDILS